MKKKKATNPLKSVEGVKEFVLIAISSLRRQRTAKNERELLEQAVTMLDRPSTRIKALDWIEGVCHARRLADVWIPESAIRGFDGNWLNLIDDLRLKCRRARGKIKIREKNDKSKKRNR